MQTLFLIAFGGGLAMAVYSMLHGVEKEREGAIARPRPYLNLPAFAAFSAVMGASGYLLAKHATLTARWVAVVALLAGASALVGMTLLMAKWALGSPSSGSLEGEEIQGKLAVVVTSVTASVAGQIQYERNGRTVTAPARSIDGHSLQKGAEVVIDRFDSDIAIVEAWSSVEARL